MFLDVKVKVWMVCVASLPESKSESLPLVLKDKSFSQGERFTVQLSLDRVLSLQKWDT